MVHMEGWWLSCLQLDCCCPWCIGLGSDSRVCGVTRCCVRVPSLNQLWLLPYYDVGGLRTGYFTVFIDVDQAFSAGLSQARRGPVADSLPLPWLGCSTRWAMRRDLCGETGGTRPCSFDFHAAIINGFLPRPRGDRTISHASHGRRR
jgi:hypothetical protein